MERMVPNVMAGTIQEEPVSCRCSQCGSPIHGGSELIVDDGQLWCDGCYRLMVNPDSGGDIPSKWF